MRINDVIEAMIKLYKTQISTSIPFSPLLIGSPGIGKTSLTHQFAEKVAELEGKKLIDYEDLPSDGVLDNVIIFKYINLNTIEPTDIIGKPSSRDNVMVYEPPRWVKICSKYQCIILLDELNTTVLDANFTVAMMLINERRSGEVKLHPRTFIIATGNEKDENYLVRVLPSPLINRVVRIRVENTVEDWINYMNNKHKVWDKRIASFLLHRRDLFIKPAEDTPFPSPRSWERVALLDIDDEETYYELVEGLVGSDTAKELMTFIKYRSVVDKILKTGEIPESTPLSVKYYLLGVLSEQYDKYPKILESLDNEFATLLFIMVPDKEKFVEFLKKHNPKTKTGEDYSTVILKAYSSAHKLFEGWKQD